jgi:hypothetical protein
MQSPDVFNRTQYATDMAEQLLHPTPLFQNVRSGVFLSGIRRVGKTTFLRQDLIPSLEARGAIVVYVDLWADRLKSPPALVHDAVRETLLQLATPGSRLLQRFKGLNLGAAGFAFGFQIDSVGVPGGTTLAQAFSELVAKSKSDVVLIVDEVQQTLSSDDGYSLLHALKAARDAVNSTPGTPGHFLFLGTGSHKSLVTDMATRRSQPFTGAVSAAYEVLDVNFVRWQLDRIATASPSARLPGIDIAFEGFKAMGNRPEELFKALVQLQSMTLPKDEAFPVICATLASAAADVELNAIEAFGDLGKAIFRRIALGSEQGITGLFSAEALSDYARQTGVDVEPTQVQTVADKMIAANLVTRPGHGVYMVADPFVRNVWLQQERLTLSIRSVPVPSSD